MRERFANILYESALKDDSSNRPLGIIFWMPEISLYSFKDVHRRQKLTTDFFQTFRVDYFGCECLNFEKKKNAYRGFQGVTF